ncbi:MAG: diheme cytochrome c [Betaproteobacteria bacterium]|jgi:mono/diheme cytochrome c family protein|nr:diheme cytochrome c [Betaproteobacteria bacterium]HMV20821.1 diheme cytochrome c [Rhodocyclaceae bacterium]HNM20989.1 diheme cytochrome c [Rhodocyclaceae bacterium]HNM80661.1 diheme cytochrome c [Rhodocyclaceae bacterium]
MKSITYLLLTILPILASDAAFAEEGRRYVLNKDYRDECGSCHVPYPPQMLPARSWNVLMTGLDKHFGSDASLDPAKARQIGTYLASNAARSDRPDASRTAPRITETPGFRREHRDGHDGLTAALWRSPAVKTPANCGACHTQAAEGSYRENEIRIPRNP